MKAVIIYYLRRIVLFFSVLFLSIGIINAQEFELVSGSPKLFKQARDLYLTFDYSDLRVGEYGEEEAYIEYMKDDAEKRKEGSSEEWLRSWNDARIELFQPKFIELFDKHIRAI